MIFLYLSYIFQIFFGIYFGRYLGGIGPLFLPPCSICSQACDKIPTLLDKQKSPRDKGAGNPSSQNMTAVAPSIFIAISFLILKWDWIASAISAYFPDTILSFAANLTNSNRRGALGSIGL